MTPRLDHLLRRIEPATGDNLALRLRFGLVCVQRVAHLIEHEALKQAVQVNQAYHRLLGSGTNTAWVTLVRALGRASNCS